MKIWNMLLAAAVALSTTVPMAAFADSDHGHRRGGDHRDAERRHYRDTDRDHERRDYRGGDRDRERREYRDWRRDAERRHYRDTDRDHGYRYDRACPPGLYKKDARCIPPGQARKHGRNVGDRLRIGDYRVVHDPSRYHLEQRQGWNYYRDDDRVYRVDSETQQILAVMNLISALMN